jgi:hypothetical protein
MWQAHRQWTLIFPFASFHSPFVSLFPLLPSILPLFLFSLCFLLSSLCFSFPFASFHSPFVSLSSLRSPHSFWLYFYDASIVGNRFPFSIKLRQDETVCVFLQLFSWNVWTHSEGKCFRMSTLTMRKALLWRKLSKKVKSDTYCYFQNEWQCEKYSGEIHKSMIWGNHRR